jgi:hypothetical protein
MEAADAAHLASIEWPSSMTTEAPMTRSTPIAVELAAQLLLAAAVGLFVSIVLAGAVLLLAA